MVSGTNPSVATAAPAISVTAPALAAGDSARKTLDDVAADGFDGVLFRSVRDADADLRRTALADVGAQSADLGLRIEFGVGCLGPEGDDGEVVAELRAQVAAGAATGAVDFFGYTRTVRDDPARSHSAQLDVVTRRLRALAPLLDDLGCRLNLKTHEDLSSHDVLAVIEAVGSSAVGVGLDVANLVVRGEDPVAATERLAPFVRQTHLEDVALFFVPQGLRRRLRPCGEGVLDWAAIRTALDAAPPGLRMTLEQHRGLFDVPLFEPAWFDHEQHLAARDVAALVHLARRTEQLVSEGRIPPLDRLPGQRSDDDLRAELRSSAEHLRHIA